MAKEVTLKQVAKEMNEIMAYGVDPDTKKLTEPGEQIDVDQKDKALLAEIKKRASEDLRHDDEESFSPEVWEWFGDNGISPTGGEEMEGEEEGEEGPDDSGEEEEAPAPKKGGKSESKPAAKEADKKSEKKAPPKREKGISFEQAAIDCIKGGGTKKDLTKVFTKLYEERGKGDDADFIAKRVDIYYNIALKATGKVAEKKESDKGGKNAEKATGKTSSKKPAPEEPEDEGEEEAPKKSVKKLRK